MDSNIQYIQQAPRTKINDTFTQMLNEAVLFFADKGLNITNKNGMEEILSEATLFNDYKEQMLKGVEPNEVENLNILYDNARLRLLSEANTAGIQEVAGLSIPTIRKMWARIAIKHAMPTQAVTSPRFLVSFTKAYIIDSQGVKHELPDAINHYNENIAELPRLSDEYIELPMTDVDLFRYAKEPYVASVEKHDSLDKVFYIEKIFVEAPVLTKDDGTTVTGEDQEILVHFKTDMYATIKGTVNIPVVTTDANGVVTKHGEVTDFIFATVDYATGIMTCVSTKGLIKKISLDARLSQETNEYGESVSFDIDNKDINIGVGMHLNAPLPIEWLQDTMAVYNIDGASEVVDLMSQVFAQKLELEIYNFLVKSIQVNKISYIGEFSLIPSAGYNGTPKMWREELKTVIDYYATKMKKDCKFHGGKFVIIGSGIDTMILPNVSWSFNHTSSQMSGVDVSFNIGAMSGNNVFEIVSSDLVPDGALIMMFVPGIDRMLTYKYYPYTFNVEKGYRDPNFQNVPSLMMTKRHTIEEFTPLICKINIYHNNGVIPSTPGY